LRFALTPFPVADFRQVLAVFVNVAFVLDELVPHLLFQVFEAIYRGKQAVKTQEDLRKATKFSRVKILQITGTLFANNMIQREKKDGQFVYKKGDLFFSTYRDKILNSARNRKSLAQIPTKVNPRASSNGNVIIKVPTKSFVVKNVTIDDVDSFSKAKRVPQGQAMKPIAENKFKQGVQRIIGEKGKFTDWGGEKNDLFSTNTSGSREDLPISSGLPRSATASAMEL
jgi:hypothetical protein